MSENSYQTLDIGFEQLLLSAVTGLMERWTEDDVFNAFRRASSGAEEVVGPAQEI